MEQDVFRAGVRPGAPVTGDEIKILICYILTEIKSYMSFEQLHEALLEHELVNYFELVSTVDSLEETGHIKAEGDDGEPAKYAVTALGESISGTINDILPQSVRDKAVSSAKKLLRRERRERELVAQISESDSGYEVKLAIPDLGQNLISFTVFCPTREEARLLRKRFLNDPAYIYKGTMALLTGDKNVVGEIFESGESLF